jgi:hypothetical protein
MKLVYNLGGINHARDALWIDHRSSKQRSYTSSKKMQIVQAVDRLVEEENLPQNVGAGRYPRQPTYRWNCLEDRKMTMAFNQPTNVGIWVESRRPPLRSGGLSCKFFCCMQIRLRVLR